MEKKSAKQNSRSWECDSGRVARDQHHRKIERRKEKGEKKEDEDEEEEEQKENKGKEGGIK